MKSQKQILREKLLRLMRSIAYEPSRAEMATFSDVFFQQVSAMREWDKNPMAMVVRKGKPGIFFVWNPEPLQGMNDAQLRTMLCHEMQHIRFDDMNQTGEWMDKGPQPWMHGWEPGMLFNVARDCQINDGLMRLGMAYVPGGSYGTEMLGMSTEGQDIGAVMAAIAEKFPPPPASQSGDTSPEAAEEAAAMDSEASGEDEVKVREPGKYAPQRRPASVEVSPAQLAWDNFLAEVIDTRKYRESWHRTPKRMAGIKEFAEREFLMTSKVDVPRKLASVYIDVSGSMNESGVNRICSLIRSSGMNYDLSVYCFDDGIEEWKNFRLQPAIPRRGGGTDFELCETQNKASLRYPDAVICITDGGGHVPKIARPERWTWLLYGVDAKSWGQSNAPGMRVVDLNKLVRGGR